MFENDDDDVFVVDPEDEFIPLDSADPEFIRGVEVGYMLQGAIYGFHTHIKIHSSNIEMVMRIAESHEMVFAAEDAPEEDMIIVTLCPLENDDDDEDRDDW